ncbi:MAG: adenine phosphoribosyltransferase [Oscillospiraceae bacterium]|nr:adenine phosphoribosyltransferase [Oscillospiraceae bacterium]
MKNEYYTLNVAGLTRQLPICPVNESLDIAAFIIFSDVELTIACAENLLKKIPPCDIIITAESKGIPLAYEMSRQSGIKYIVARKMAKLYMRQPLSVSVQSITTKGIQTLYLDKDEADLIEGKRVLVVDDVISTGESLKALETLVEQSGGISVGKAAVLVEGDAVNKDEIVYLEDLPLFFK